MLIWVGLHRAYNKGPEKTSIHFIQDFTPIYEEPSPDEIVETISSVLTIPENFDIKKFVHDVFNQFTKKTLDEESLKVIFWRTWCKETGEVLSEPQLQRLTDTFFQLLNNKGLVYYKKEDIDDLGKSLKDPKKQDLKEKPYVQIASPKNSKIKRASSGDLRECIERSLTLAAEEDDEQEEISE